MLSKTFVWVNPKESCGRELSVLEVGTFCFFVECLRRLLLKKCLCFKVYLWIKMITVGYFMDSFWNLFQIISYQGSEMVVILIQLP